MQRRYMRTLGAPAPQQASPMPDLRSLFTPRMCEPGEESSGSCSVAAIIAPLASLSGLMKKITAIPGEDGDEVDGMEMWLVMSGCWDWTRTKSCL